MPEAYGCNRREWIALKEVVMLMLSCGMLNGIEKMLVLVHRDGFLREPNGWTCLLDHRDGCLRELPNRWTCFLVLAKLTIHEANFSAYVSRSRDWTFEIRFFIVHLSFLRSKYENADLRHGFPLTALRSKRTIYFKQAKPRP